MTRRRVQGAMRPSPSPVILGRAIYLGPRPTARLTLKGQVVIRRGRKRTIRTGSTTYTFSPEQVVPDDFAVVSYRGRPVVQVDHAGHLLTMMRRCRAGKPLFHCLVGRLFRDEFDAWRMTRGPKRLRPQPRRPVAAWMIE